MMSRMAHVLASALSVLTASHASAQGTDVFIRLSSAPLLQDTEIKQLNSAIDQALTYLGPDRLRLSFAGANESPKTWPNYVGPMETGCRVPDCIEISIKVDTTTPRSWSLTLLSYKYLNSEQVVYDDANESFTTALASVLGYLLEKGPTPGSESTIGPCYGHVFASGALYPICANFPFSSDNEYAVLKNADDCLSSLRDWVSFESGKVQTQSGTDRVSLQNVTARRLAASSTSITSMSLLLVRKKVVLPIVMSSDPFKDGCSTVALVHDDTLATDKSVAVDISQTRLVDPPASCQVRRPWLQLAEAKRIGDDEFAVECGLSSNSQFKGGSVSSYQVPTSLEAADVGDKRPCIDLGKSLEEAAPIRECLRQAGSDQWQLLRLRVSMSPSLASLALGLAKAPSVELSGFDCKLTKWQFICEPPRADLECDTEVSPVLRLPIVACKADTGKGQ